MGMLDGKVAIVTGAGHGIGRGHAMELAKHGATVIVNDLGGSVTGEGAGRDADLTVDIIKARGGQAAPNYADVSDHDQAGEMIAQAVNDFGRLDILVNNAAFQQHVDSLEALSEEQFDTTMRTNVYGYFHMAKAALPHLRAGSAIINTGSETGLFGSAKLLDYSATKGAIHAFSKSLAMNLVGRGIRVNVVAPGPVWTPLNPADRHAGDIPHFGADTGMKRPAQPEEIAPAFVFLAAPVCSSYITGIELPIMGQTPGAS